jgi:hypothetical protein
MVDNLNIRFIRSLGEEFCKLRIGYLHHNIRVLGLPDIKTN